MGYIYLITNQINNKKYVGQTTLTINMRWERHVYDALQQHDDFYFHRAIRKYGAENFDVVQLSECSNEELDEQEIYYIDKYQTYYIYGQGYNLTRGGSGTTKINEKEILKQWHDGKSAIEIARYFGFYTRTVTNVLKRNNITQYEIYSRSHQYGARFRYKRIFQYDFSGNLMNIYETLNDVHEQTGYNKDYISAACRHVYPSANGYIWVYEDDEEDIASLIARLPQELNCPVLQYDTLGNFICEYSSYISAARALACDPKLIMNAAKSKSATAKGYFWKNKNDQVDIMEKIITYNNRYNGHKKKVAQIDKDNTIIAIYESITDAANKIGQPALRSAITKVCNGKQKTSGGYRWAYVEE